MFDLGVKEDTSILNLSWNECNSGIGLLETVNVKQWEKTIDFDFASFKLKQM